MSIRVDRWSGPSSWMQRCRNPLQEINLLFEMRGNPQAIGNKIIQLVHVRRRKSALPELPEISIWALASRDFSRSMPEGSSGDTSSIASAAAFLAIVIVPMSDSPSITSRRVSVCILTMPGRSPTWL